MPRNTLLGHLEDFKQNYRSRMKGVYISKDDEKTVRQKHDQIANLIKCLGSKGRSADVATLCNALKYPDFSERARWALDMLRDDLLKNPDFKPTPKEPHEYALYHISPIVNARAFEWLLTDLKDTAKASKIKDWTEHVGKLKAEESKHNWLVSQHGNDSGEGH